MFNKNVVNSLYSSRNLAVKSTKLPREKKRHSIGTIMRRTQIPGRPSSEKFDPKKGGMMTQRIRKVHGLESTYIQRLLHEANTLTGLQRQQNSSKTVSGKESKRPESLNNKHYPPKKLMPNLPPTWGNKMG